MIEFSRDVVDSVLSISYRGLSANVVERSRQALLDWLGVTIAGSLEPSARIARSVVLAEGGIPTSSVLGQGLRAAASQAALVNGIAGHSMDFDDLGLGGHPSVPILSALISLAEELGSSGQDTIAAMVSGYQAMALIGFSSGHTSYIRGFHTTGTIGVFGSTAACGHLLGLDATEMTHAIGLAATQAAGLKASFGSMGKHLNAAKAAASGLLAARLAAAGFTGAPNAIEAHQGFAACFNDANDQPSMQKAVATMAGRLGVEMIYYKYYASCGATHSAIASILEALSDRTFTTDEIARVQLLIPAAALDVCGVREPSTGLEAKFSIWHAASLALARRDLGPDGFTDLAAMDSTLAELRTRIDVVPDADLSLSDPTTVVIRLKGGAVLEHSVNTSVVQPDELLAGQATQLSAKFLGLVEPVLGPRTAARLLRNISEIEKAESLSAVFDVA